MHGGGRSGRRARERTIQPSDPNKDLEQALSVRYRELALAGFDEPWHAAAECLTALDLLSKADGIGTVGVVVDVGDGARPRAWLATSGTIEPEPALLLVDDVYDPHRWETSLPSVPSLTQRTWRLRDDPVVEGPRMRWRYRRERSTALRALERHPHRSRVRINATPLCDGGIAVEVAVETTGVDLGLIGGLLC